MRIFGIYDSEYGPIVHIHISAKDGYAIMDVEMATTVLNSCFDQVDIDELSDEAKKVLHLPVNGE